jgi:hypothetical protein
MPNIFVSTIDDSGIEVFINTAKILYFCSYAPKEVTITFDDKSTVVIKGTMTDFLDDIRRAETQSVIRHQNKD